MIPKQVIEKAIEGGWSILGLTGQMTFSWSWRINPFHPEQEIMVVQDDIGEPHDLDYYQTVLDPTFWQALGKALGWKEVETEWRHANSNTSEVYSFSNERWANEAHSFYDLILTRGDTETYWNELLK